MTVSGLSHKPHLLAMLEAWERHPFRHRRHGQSRTREYKAWTAMKDRCHNPRHAKFHYYGGRGIVVCDRWRESFLAFLADMGPRPSAKHSIDRIDNNGNYEPSNCRWAMKSEQIKNRRRASAMPLQIDEVALRRTVKDFVAAIEAGWDEQGLTGQERDVRISKLEDCIAKLKMRRLTNPGR